MKFVLLLHALYTHIETFLGKLIDVQTHPIAATHTISLISHVNVNIIILMLYVTRYVNLVIRKKIFPESIHAVEHGGYNETLIT